MLPSLPDNSPADAIQTWKQIGELRRIRAVLGDAEPMPLSAPWLASLNGTNELTIRNGKRWLAQHGYIIHVADGRVSFGKPTKLWVTATETSR